MSVNFSTKHACVINLSINGWLKRVAEDYLTAKIWFPEEVPACIPAKLTLYRHFMRTVLQLRGGRAETKYATVASLPGMLTYHECSRNCGEGRCRIELCLYVLRL